MPSGKYYRTSQNRKNLGKAQRGRVEGKAANWKGTNAGYSALHKWIRKWKGTPLVCENCGIKKNRMGWANKDHLYKRVLEDWIFLCPKCHGVYDKENALRKWKVKI